MFLELQSSKNKPVLVNLSKVTQITAMNNGEGSVIVFEASMPDTEDSYIQVKEDYEAIKKHLRVCWKLSVLKT